MGIVDDDIDRVKAASDLVQLVSEHAQVKKVGRRFVALCPFHAEKTPSFTINAEEKLYYCYGCQAKGDVIRFVEQTQHLDFVGAVEWLAGRYGITLRYDDAKAGAERQRRTLLHEAMERAVDFYHQRLLSSPDAGAARGYLRSRGYDRDVVERFRIGWAPDEWDALARALALPADVLADTGLGFVNRVGKQQDSFRARVMFPIFDAAGRAVAFGGRVLPGGDGPKYKNSPETKLYSKSRTLYALNWAKEDAARSDELIVCEGYTDVIAFFEAGLPRAVATCGTALGDEHFRLLKSFAPRIVLAYDADAAGQAAASRFYEWEQRYEVDVAVAGLPAGADPAEVARRDPEGLRQAVKSARPFLEFRLDRVLAGANLRTAEGRAKAAQEALAVVAEHPNDLVRDQYLMRVADVTRVEADRLRQLSGRGVTRQPPAPSPPRGHVDHAEGPELAALRLAVHQPADVPPWVDATLFSDDAHLDAFEALCTADTLTEAIDKARPEVAALLQRLAVDNPPDTSAEDIVRRLVHAAGLRALSDLQARLRTDLATDDMRRDFQELKKLTERFRDSATGMDDAEQLVAWLVLLRTEGE